MHKYYIKSLFIVIAILALPGIAYAACTSPAGEAGTMDYFTSENTFQFCDGTNWVDMGGGGGGPDYESAETTIATIGDQTYTFTHGLASTPSQYDAYLICKTAEMGYSVGDEVKTTNQYIKASSGAVWGGHNVIANATNVVVEQEARIYIANRASGNFPTTPTAANWKLIVRAWN